MRAAGALKALSIAPDRRSSRPWCRWRRCSVMPRRCAPAPRDAQLTPCTLPTMTKRHALSPKKLWPRCRGRLLRDGEKIEISLLEHDQLQEKCMNQFYKAKS